MKSRQVCVVCGKPVEPAYACRQKAAGKVFLCARCTAEERARKKDAHFQKKRELFGVRKCLLCGKPVPWVDSYAQRNPKYYPVACSKSCRSELAARKLRAVKEDVINDIKAFIKRKGHYVSYAEVVKGTTHKNALLCKLGISIKELNKEVLGLSTVEPALEANKDYDLTVLSFPELCAAYGIEAHDVKDLVAGFKRAKKFRFGNLSCCFLTDVCLHLILKEGRYIGPVRLSEMLGIGRNRLVDSGVDVPLLNRLLGYNSYQGSSYFEEWAFRILLDYIDKKDISRQHIFSDCKSVCRHMLEFDFYIPKHRLFVEIDGTQHETVKDTKRLSRTKANDAIKDAYAASLGFTMLRIPTAPEATFESRLREKVLGIVKPVELLEPRPDNAEGNQQPSPQEGKVQRLSKSTVR